MKPLSCDYTRIKNNKLSWERGGYMKLFPKNRKEKVVYTKQTSSPIQDAVLLKEIEKVKSDMDNAYANFQNVLDPDLIDCYIFESNAALKRYHFLLKQAKKIV